MVLREDGVSVLACEWARMADGMSVQSCDKLKYFEGVASSAVVVACSRTHPLH